MIPFILFPYLIIVRGTIVSLLNRVNTVKINCHSYLQFQLGPSSTAYSHTNDEDNLPIIIERLHRTLALSDDHATAEGISW